MKSLRSSNAIRTPARTLVRVIPADATVLPPAPAGLPSVWGARRFTMPLASATQVALSRLTRILLLVAVTLCLGAPTAGADAAKLDNTLAALWTKALTTPFAQNPSTPPSDLRALTSAARLHRLDPSASRRAR